MDNSPDQLETKKWFAYVGNQHEGPFTVKEIKDKIAQKIISVDGFVWSEGMADWMPMSQIPVFGDGPTLTTLSKELPHDLLPEPSPMTLVAASQVEQPEMTLAGEPTQLLSGQPSSETPAQKVTKLPFSKKWGFVAVLVLLFSASSLGLLKPVFEAPLFRIVGQTVSANTRPMLMSLVLRFPALGKWFSPLPVLDDVSPADYAEMKNAALTLADQGSAGGLAFSKADLLSPVFYVSSNLPDGTGLDVKIQGVVDTLLNQVKFQSQSHVTIQMKFGKTEPFRAMDGKAIPRGEYTVSVIERDGQPGRAVLVQKNYFLGGPRDETYLVRLKDYHAKVKEKAAAEMAEIKQFSGLLESQLTSTIATFSKLSVQISNKKNLKAWTDFDDKWTQLASQLSEAFRKLTPDSLANDYFYGSLYQLSQQASQDIDKLHDVHHAFFKAKTDLKSIDVQLSQLATQALDSVNILKNRIIETDKETEKTLEKETEKKP